MSYRAKVTGIVFFMALLGCVAVADQSTPLRRVMHDKLGHSHQLLEALVTSNWSSLEAHARALQQIAETPAWNALATSDYVRYTSDFTRAAQELADRAHARDLEGAPLAYVSLTLTCVQCHRYVARARVASR